MTTQEVAVALSHIEVWKLVASGDVSAALILEDDVFMTYGFADGVEKVWTSLVGSNRGEPPFDLVYLAFDAVGNLSPTQSDEYVRRLTRPGIWEAAGYVLSREGAQKLLDRLPVYGPIDLWLNMQFEHLRAFTAARPLIEQRIDEPSTNSYSVLPALSQVGLITREKPLVPAPQKLAGPVLAVGDHGSGLTALATALSMVGYTCCSDLDRLPGPEYRNLKCGSRERLFNAYVNIGSLSADAFIDVAEANPDALFITTSSQRSLPSLIRDRILRLPPNMSDKWAALSEFLGIDYPAFSYPSDHDLGQRHVRERTVLDGAWRRSDLKPDTSPWILRPGRSKWNGIAVDDDFLPYTLVAAVDWSSGGTLDDEIWQLRDDTFPSNLALFTPANFSHSEGSAILTLREEDVSVRTLTSAAIATQKSYLYGRFRAALRPPGIPGLVTGVFLHRNGPRQEIDIEFVGKDTRKMLVNVFYNPGPGGTKLEYGYRGTPTLIDLGFDAADDFHTYEIDWRPNAIRWLVDGNVVHERHLWDPTPIPNQPLEFNLNLWHSRSKEFAGSLSTRRLPASASIKSIEVHAASVIGAEAIAAGHNSSRSQLDRIGT